MLKRILIPLFVLLLAFTAAIHVSAQDLPYYFGVEKEVVHVYWNSDGSMSVDYTWIFANQPGSHPIDFVDVGMPNFNFEIDTITADVDGSPVSISPATTRCRGT